MVSKAGAVHARFKLEAVRLVKAGQSMATVGATLGNTDLSGAAVLADVAEDVVVGSSRNGAIVMKRQMSFAEVEGAGKKRVTRRERFLAEMERGGGAPQSAAAP